VDHWHVFTDENKAKGVYSRTIEDCGGGGADVVYSATGWAGHTAFIDPGTEEFKANSMEEFLKLDSRLVTLTPITICQNSLSACIGASGDVWAVSPKAVTVGPRDIYNARYRFSMHHFLINPGGSSWQRMISRIELYGPVSMECPSSIMRLKEGTCYVSEGIAKPFGSWKYGAKYSELY
jgi:6-phosphogluconolactonase/glucosamine-6-phosphate isomerase/deaminase